MNVIAIIYSLMALASAIDVSDYIDRLFEDESIAELDYGILPASQAPDEPASEVLPDRAPIGVPEGDSGRVPAGNPNRIPEGNSERGSEGKIKEADTSGVPEAPGKSHESDSAIEPHSNTHRDKSGSIAKAKGIGDDDGGDWDEGFIALYTICSCSGFGVLAFVCRLLYRAYHAGEIGMSLADRVFDQIRPFFAYIRHGPIPAVIPMPPPPLRALPPV